MLKNLSLLSSTVLTLLLVCLLLVCASATAAPTRSKHMMIQAVAELHPQRSFNIASSANWFNDLDTYLQSVTWKRSEPTPLEDPTRQSRLLKLNPLIKDLEEHLSTDTTGWASHWLGHLLVDQALLNGAPGAQLPEDIKARVRGHFESWLKKSDQVLKVGDLQSILNRLTKDGVDFELQTVFFSGALKHCWSKIRDTKKYVGPDLEILLIVLMRFLTPYPPIQNRPKFFDQLARELPSPSNYYRILLHSYLGNQGIHHNPHNYAFSADELSKLIEAPKFLQKIFEELADIEKDINGPRMLHAALQFSRAVGRKQIIIPEDIYRITPEVARLSTEGTDVDLEKLREELVSLKYFGLIACLDIYRVVKSGHESASEIIPLLQDASVSQTQHITLINRLPQVLEDYLHQFSKQMTDRMKLSGTTKEAESLTTIATTLASLFKAGKPGEIVRLTMARLFCHLLIDQGYPISKWFSIDELREVLITPEKLEADLSLFKQTKRLWKDPRSSTPSGPIRTVEAILESISNLHREESLDLFAAPQDWYSNIDSYLNSIEWKRGKQHSIKKKDQEIRIASIDGLISEIREGHFSSNPTGWASYWLGHLIAHRAHLVAKPDAPIPEPTLQEVRAHWDTAKAKGYYPGFANISLDELTRDRSHARSLEAIHANQGFQTQFDPDEPFKSKRKELQAEMVSKNQTMPWVRASKVLEPSLGLARLFWTRPTTETLAEWYKDSGPKVVTKDNYHSLRTALHSLDTHDEWHQIESQSERDPSTGYLILTIQTRTELGHLVKNIFDLLRELGILSSKHHPEFFDKIEKNLSPEEFYRITIYGYLQSKGIPLTTMDGNLSWLKLVENIPWHLEELMIRLAKSGLIEPKRVLSTQKLDQAITNDQILLPPEIRKIITDESEFEISTTINMKSSTLKSKVDLNALRSALLETSDFMYVALLDLYRKDWTSIHDDEEISVIRNLLRTTSVRLPWFQKSMRVRLSEFSERILKMDPVRGAEIIFPIFNEAKAGDLIQIELARSFCRLLLERDLDISKWITYEELKAAFDAAPKDKMDTALLKRTHAILLPLLAPPSVTVPDPNPEPEAEPVNPSDSRPPYRIASTYPEFSLPGMKKYLEPVCNPDSVRTGGPVRPDPLMQAKALILTSPAEALKFVDQSYKYPFDLLKWGKELILTGHSDTTELLYQHVASAMISRPLIETDPPFYLIFMNALFGLYLDPQKPDFSKAYSTLQKMAAFAKQQLHDNIANKTLDKTRLLDTEHYIKLIETHPEFKAQPTTDEQKAELVASLTELYRETTDRSSNPKRGLSIIERYDLAYLCNAKMFEIENVKKEAPDRALMSVQMMLEKIFLGQVGFDPKSNLNWAAYWRRILEARRIMKEGLQAVKPFLEPAQSAQ